MTRTTLHPKIRPGHLRRQAIVYIRQSTAQPVRRHRESTQRQYALAERAVALGWPAAAVVTIDEDQGRSGAGAAHRQGFKRLLAATGAGPVGIVLALEASRLARSSADGHRLVEIGAVTRTPLADEGARYDPRDPNDRLLLGAKGTISEAELFTLRCRLNEGRGSKARRGELARSLPVGYVRAEGGKVVKDPDRQVQARLGYVFRRFARLKAARRVIARLAEEGLTIPARAWGGPGHGQLLWQAPGPGALMRLLHNPTYAGASVYGPKEYDPFGRYASNGKAKAHPRPPEDGPVCLPGVSPASISWAQFVENQRILRGNWYRAESRGAPRQGAALLQGIVFCGRCGAGMSVLHYATKERRAPGDGCFAASQRRGGATCQCPSARGIDEAVAQRFRRAASPAQVEIALQALEELAAGRREAQRQWQLQRQGADYEVELARRRYEASDPAKRLVAGALEARWEEALRQRGRLRRACDEFERGPEAPLSDQERATIKRLSGGRGRVWGADTTTRAGRKTLLRFLVKRAHLDGVSAAGKIRIAVAWQTGARTATAVDRLAVGVWAPRAPDEAVRRVRELLPDHDDAAIAERLNEEGRRSAKGLPFKAMTVGYIVRSRGWNGESGHTPTSAGGEK